MISLLFNSPVDLSGRHIFVTGGTGFLGKHLLDYFAESVTLYDSDLRVTVLSRSPDNFFFRSPQYLNMHWLRVVKGDLKNLPRDLPDVTDVIHAAADTHDFLDKRVWIEQIAGGTDAVLTWSLAAGVRRFLLTSSGAVYGPQPQMSTHISEEYLGAPSTTVISSVYGQAKRLAEQFCAIYASTTAIDTVIARCFAVIGPHIPSGRYAIESFINDALVGDVIRVFGDGLAVRTYMYGRDMAHWLVTLLIRGRSGDAYNVGSDQPINMAQLAAEVARIVSPNKRVVVENTMSDDGSRSLYVPQISKAQSIGLSLETSLTEAIRLTANAIRGR